jgi:hypothetical protein
MSPSIINTRRTVLLVAFLGFSHNMKDLVIPSHMLRLPKHKAINIAFANESPSMKSSSSQHIGNTSAIQNNYTITSFRVSRA